MAQHVDHKKMLEGRKGGRGAEERNGKGGDLRCQVS